MKTKAQIEAKRISKERAKAVIAKANAPKVKKKDILPKYSPVPIKKGKK